MKSTSLARFYFITNGTRSVNLVVSSAGCFSNGPAGIVKMNREEVANAIRYARAKKAAISCEK